MMFQLEVNDELIGMISVNFQNTSRQVPRDLPRLVENLEEGEEIRIRELQADHKQHI